VPKAAARTTIAVAAISLVAWISGYIDSSYRYHWRDFWFLVVLYAIPVILVALSSWVAFHPKPWRMLLGGALLLPSAIIWVLYLMLAVSSFRIH
jgi:hypothetical protein